MLGLGHENARSTNMESNLTEKIIDLLRKMLPYEEINNTTELIENGILNSLSIMMFVTQLEDEFGIEIPDDAVTSENFANVLKITRLVKECHAL